MEEDFSKLPKSPKEAKEAGERYYYTGKPCKRGHLTKRLAKSAKCCLCFKEDREKPSRKEYCLKWREDNIERDRKNKKEYKLKNKEYFSDWDKEYYQENKEIIKKRSNDWYYNNIPRVRESTRNRRKNNPKVKCTKMCNDLIRRVLISTGRKKKNRSRDILGYDGETLRAHLESKFLDGMSWENYGEWHVDHIFPVTRFLQKGIDSPAIINSLDNLIPMWAEHNYNKHDKTLEEYLEINPHLKELYGEGL